MDRELRSVKLLATALRSCRPILAEVNAGVLPEAVKLIVEQAVDTAVCQVAARYEGRIDDLEARIAFLERAR